MRRRIQQLTWTMLAGVMVAGVDGSSQAALDGRAAWAEALRGSWIDAPTSATIERLIDGAGAALHQRVTEGQPPLEVVAITRPGAATAQALFDAADPSLDRLSAWLGPLPGRRLTIVDVPSHAGLAGAAYPGIAITSSRWLTTRREFAAERALTVAIARQYALSLVTGPDHNSWLAEGLANYFATRAIHEAFEGRYYQTLRYFGGYVPTSIRAILISPNPLDPRPRLNDLPEVDDPFDAPWRLAHGDDRARARRLSIALHTLERFVGWPALQSALKTFIERNIGKTPHLQDLAAVLSEQRGADLAWFFDQAMRMDATFDYAVVNLTSALAGPGGWQTTVEVRRLGEAVFAGTSQARTASAARSLPVLVRFADGAEITEWIDGRDREWRFEYTSKAPAVLASVDPGAMLLLDTDRTNNTRSLERPTHRVGLRLAFNWLSWLQDAMLACTSVI